MEREFRVQIEGADLCVRQRGERPATVFVHGFGSDRLSWEPLWQALGETFPALSYDLRGFGESREAGDEPFSHADDLIALLDACDIGRANLVAVSMGGGVAVNCALNAPERVASLVLISPALVGWEWSQRWRELWRPLVDNARAGDMDRARELWWRHPLFDTLREGPAGQMLYDSIQRYSGAQWVRDNQRHELPDVERLHQLAQPTLLLTGERDMEDFRVIANLLEECARDVTRVDVPDAGHSLQLEVPDICARHIRAFLEQAPER